MTLKSFVFCASFFIWFHPALSSASAPERKTMSFASFIELVKKNDPNLAGIMAEKERTAFLTDLGLPAKQLLLQASSEYGISSQDNQNTNRNNVVASKNFIETGTEISVGYTKNDLADREEEVFEVRLRQSLLRNMFGRYTKIQKSALEDEASSLALQTLDAYENYLADLGSLYLDYARAWLNTRLAQTILGETRSLLENVQKMKQNNIASQTDVERAKLQVALRKEDLVSLETELASLEARVAAASNIDGPVPRPDLNSFQVFLPRAKTAGVKLENLRVYKIAALNKESAGKRQVLAQKLDTPALSLVAGYNVDESSRFGTAVNREEKIVGLNFTMPFGNSRNKALLKEASLEKLKSEIAQTGTKRLAKQTFETLRAQLKKARETLELNREKVALSKKVWQGELERYNYGNLPLDRLIEAKNAFSLYRYQLRASSAAYYKLALRWMDFADKFMEKL